MKVDGKASDTLFYFLFYHLLGVQEWIVYPVWRARSSHVIYSGTKKSYISVIEADSML